MSSHEVSDRIVLKSDSLIFEFFGHRHRQGAGHLVSLQVLLETLTAVPTCVGLLACESNETNQRNPDTFTSTENSSFSRICNYCQKQLIPVCERMWRLMFEP